MNSRSSCHRSYHVRYHALHRSCYMSHVHATTILYVISRESCTRMRMNLKYSMVSSFMLLTSAVPIFPSLKLTPHVSGWLFGTLGLAQFAALFCSLALINRGRHRHIIAVGVFSGLVACGLFTVAFWPDNKKWGLENNPKLFCCFIARALNGIAIACIVPAGQAHLKDVG